MHKFTLVDFSRNLTNIYQDFLHLFANYFITCKKYFNKDFCQREIFIKINLVRHAPKA